MAYRDYTAQELEELAHAMERAAKTLREVAAEMEAEKLNPSEFNFPATLTPKAVDKAGSDSRLQMNDLLREKRTGQEAEYRIVRKKNEKKAKKLAKKIAQDLAEKGFVKRKRSK